MSTADNTATSSAPAAPVDPLAALEAQAHELETGNIPAGLPGAPPPAPPPALAGPDPNKLAENAAIFDMVFAIVLPWAAERYSKPYDEERRAEIARSWTVLEQKRGWDLGAMIEGWGPELAFGVAMLGPIAGVASRDVRDLVAERRRKAAGQAAVPAPARAAAAPPAP